METAGAQVAFSPLSPEGRVTEGLTNDTLVIIDSGPPSTVTSQILVDGVGHILEDVNVTLSVNHTYVSDLVVTLISPAGTRVELLNQVGGSRDNLRTTTLDDEASVPIASGTAPFTGAFGPQQSLAVLEGQDPRGTWTLEIQDVAFQDGGALTQWGLELTTAGVSDDGLVAYWSFDDGQGDTATDGSAQGTDNPATLRHDTAWNGFGFNGAVSFDGVDDLVSISNATDLNLLTLHQRTVSLWFYAEDVSLSRKQVLYEEGGHLRGLSLYIEDGWLYAGGWNTPQSETGWSGTYLSTPIDPGAWHHVALVLDGGPTVSQGALTGYLDGQAFGQGEGSMVLRHPGKIGIGHINGNTLFHDGSRRGASGFLGLIDEARVYNRALDAMEIESLASLTLTDPVTPQPPPPTSGFEIEVRFTDSSLTDEQRAMFQSAADRWSQIILGDLPDVTTSIGLVDDVVIDARGVVIDGQGGVLGSAGPTQLRPGSFLPARGTMQFDLADMGSLIADGRFEDVILHEMGHVIGFGTIWGHLGLVQGPGTFNPVFTGQAAQAQYADLFGLSRPTPVPVANTGGAGTRDAHWRESVFGSELMTGFLNSGSNPISRVTAASLIDIGYVVDLDAADVYTPPGLLNGGFVARGVAALPPLSGADHGIVLRPVVAVLPQEALG